MVLMVWAAQGSFVLLQIVAGAGVGGWLLALLWLRFYDFAAVPDTHAGSFRLAAGTLATLAAWCALVLIHGDQPVQADPPMGHRWLLTALAIVWAADSGAYFAGRHFGGRVFKGRKLAPRISPNKTAEGLVGGLLAGIATGLAFGRSEEHTSELQ